MVLDTNNLPHRDGLARIKCGEILILGEGECSALLVKQALHAELVSAGSAVGGSFDDNVTEFYSIGKISFVAPLNLNERYRAIKHRQADVDRMLQFWKENDPLERATSFIEMLCHRFGYEQSRDIPRDFLVRLTGTNMETVDQAWEKLASIDVTEAVISSELSTDSPAVMLLPANISANPPVHNKTKGKSRGKNKKRGGIFSWRLLLFLASLVSGAVGLTYYMLSNGTLPKPEPAVSVASEAVVPPEPRSISALGFIEPQGEVVKLSAPAFMEGTRVEKLLVSQGDTVKKGSTIAILDNRDRLQSILEQTQQSVKVAEAKLLQVKAGSKTGDIKAQDAKIRSSQAELQGQVNAQQAAIANIQSQLEGERSTQEALILQIKAELANATQECSRYDMLLEGVVVSKSQRDNVCLSQSTAQERLAQATTSLTRIVNTRQQQIKEAQANLQRTVNTIKNDIAATAGSRDAIAEVRPVDVQLANQELISAQFAVKKAQADLAQAYVLSPIDGQVLKIHTWPGEIVNQQKGITELGRTGQMYVSADIYETDISRIRKGQKATIKADRVTGTLTGIVDQIGLRIGTPNTLGTDPVKEADVRVVQVKIRLTPEDSKKVANLTNLQVNVVISPKS